jgi:hypothetical protein
MRTSKNRDHKNGKEDTGLLALGSSGSWEVAIDETLTAPTRYFAQIEGPSIYLYFQIPTPELIESALGFIGHSADGHATPRNGDLRIGDGISLVKDDEFDDRFFLVIEAKSGPVVRFTIADDDLSHLVHALRSAKEDLHDD